MATSQSSKYLSTYAEPETRNLPSDLGLNHSFDYGVSLPLRGESLTEIAQRLSSLQELVTQQNKRLLLVAVINGARDSQPDYHQANHDLVSFLRAQSPSWKDSFLVQHRSPHMTVLWVDRAIHQPFQPKQGVGLARKIGCDLLCRFHSDNKLLSPWLFTTDADAALPPDYFEMPESLATAFHFSYRHDQSGFEGSDALILYEIHLRYYFLGLLWARSPYAYPTIGSCLAIRVESYEQVRGFQDRQAGEDFHLLNKLRKLGPIGYRKSPPITLRGRFSQRVPFGTGQSTIDIHNQLLQQVPYTLYSPDSFSFLRSFLLKTTESLSQDTELGRKHFNDYWNDLAASQPTLFSCLKDLQVPDIVDSAFLTRTKPAQRLRHFHTSFDALKTLRLVHLIEERCFPRLVWNEALQKAPFFGLDETIHEPRRTLERLQHLEETALGGSFVEESYF